jgi:hypothetical protein
MKAEVYLFYEIGYLWGPNKVYGCASLDIPISAGLENFAFLVLSIAAIYFCHLFVFNSRQAYATKHASHSRAEGS